MNATEKHTPHTPGPWFVGAQNDGLYILNGSPSPAPYDGPIPKEYGPEVVATPNWRLPSYEANARLIAAAPELFEALQELLSDCEEYARVNKLHGPDGGPATNHAMRQARAALTKATQP